MTHSGHFFASSSRHAVHVGAILGVLLSFNGCVDNPNPIGTVPQDVLQSDAPYDDSPDVQAADYLSFLGGVNGFGLELFRRGATANENNVVFSPVSLSVALGMAYAGAAGDTATEMKSVLRDPWGDATYHQSMNRLALDVRSRNRAPTSTEDPQSIAVNLVDSVWVERSLPIRGAFLDTLATEYNAGVRLADFAATPDAARQAINAWAIDQSEGKLTDLFAPGDIDSLTRVVLANALYLKASWAKPFTKTSTSDGSFQLATGASATLPMMHATRSMGYYAGTNYRVISLPYVGDELSMQIVLPAQGEFEAVRDAIDETWMDALGSSLANVNVSLTLPKFRLTSGTEMFNADLAAMGMPSAFNESAADFSAMSSSQLFIKMVVQKAFVGIDELGTEAAAVSAVVVSQKSAVMPDQVVTVDHPFLFAIRDKSGALLFVGQILDPSRQ